MSANNWSICPQCKDEADDELTSAYGKITEDEYLALLQQKREKSDDKVTLREDWEIGVDKYGLFYVDYRCSCSVCKFSYKYKYENQVYNLKEIE